MAIFGAANSDGICLSENNRAYSIQAIISLKRLNLCALGSQTQKGIITYAISANRQRPLAGTAHAAVFNSWRRFRAQALYVLPPLAIAYLTMSWAIEKYVLPWPVDGAESVR